MPYNIKGSVAVAKDLSAGGLLTLASTTNSTTGTQDDLALAASTLYYTGAGVSTITGFAVSGGNIDGTVLTVWNTSASALTLANLTGSAAGNQIYTGGTDLGIPAGASVELVYDGANTRWITGPASFATSVPLSSITAGTAANSIDSLNFGQTWAWSTATTETPLALSANSLTSGSLLALSSTGTGTTGNLFSVTSASTAPAANGLARFNFSGAHTGNGLQVDDATVSGKAVRVNANSLTTGTALEVNVNALATTGAGISVVSTNTGTSGNLLYMSTPSTGFSSGAVRFEFTGAHSGTGFQLTDGSATGRAMRIVASTTAGTAFQVEGSTLTNGSLGLFQDSGTSATGSVLLVSSGSTSAVTNGLARFNFTGAHTGNGLQVDDATATGTAVKINVDSLTSGVGLDIASTGTGTTGQLLSITSPSTAAVSNGLVRMQFTGAYTGGPGLRIDSSTVNGDGIDIRMNAGTDSVGLFVQSNALTTGKAVLASTTSTGFTGNLLSASSTGNASGVTGALCGLLISGAASKAKAISISNAGLGVSVDVQGALALQAGTDFSTTGTTTDASFGNSSLIRLTGASAQTIDGIAAGIDGTTTGINGRLLTLVNAGTTTATLGNAVGTANNQVITGTGGNLPIPPSGAVVLQYDSTSTSWRVIAVSASTGYVPTAAKSAAYTLTAQDGLVNFTTGASSFNATLPLISDVGYGKVYQIRKADSGSGTVTITRQSPDTINGANTLAASAQYQSWTLCSAADGWNIL